MDGWVIIGTKLDSKQLEKDLKDAEKKLQQYERESEKLTKQKVKVEIDLQPYEEQKRLIKETTDEMLTKSQTEEQVKNVLEMEQMQLEGLNKKYSKQLENVSSINQKIQTNVKNQELMKTQIDEMSKKVKGLDIDFSKISKSTSDVIKKVGRWALAIFSVRGAYSAVRRAMSTLTQYNETLANQLNTINLMFASALEPLINRIVNLVYKLMSYVNYIAKAWFGIDLFANASADAMNKTNKSAQKLKKTLTGFDEMNVLNDNGTTGIGNAPTTPSGGFEIPEGEEPGWLSWIAKNKDIILSTLTGIGAALAAWQIEKLLVANETISKVNIGEIIGIGVAVAGLMHAIQGLLQYLKEPTWENFGQIIQGIGIAVTGLGVAFLGLPAIITGVVVTIVGTICCLNTLTPASKSILPSLDGLIIIFRAERKPSTALNKPPFVM